MARYALPDTFTQQSAHGQPMAHNQTQRIGQKRANLRQALKRQQKRPLRAVLIGYRFIF